MIEAILALAGQVFSKVLGSKAEAQKQEFLIAFHKILSETELAKAQINVNANEALSQSMFVSGWRPWLGWGFGTLMMVYISATVCINVAISYGYHISQLPPLDPMVRDVVMGMLGLSITTRTYEKIKGVNR